MHNGVLYVYVGNIKKFAYSLIISITHGSVNAL